jgi:hypothetical protein
MIRKRLIFLLDIPRVAVYLVSIFVVWDWVPIRFTRGGDSGRPAGYLRVVVVGFGSAVPAVVLVSV